MSPEELQDNRDRRQFWERIIILVLAAVPSWFGMVMQYRTGDRLVQADSDRVRIEEKIDEQKEVAKVAVEEAKVAVNHAVTAAQETKAAVAEIKGTMPRGEPGPE